jgi:hypothetical protein
MKYEIVNEYPYTKIFINEFLHLKFVTRKLIGVQSWKETENLFCIELYLEGGNILCEYDEQSKWVSILELLEKEL